MSIAGGYNDDVLKELIAGKWSNDSERNNLWVKSEDLKQFFLARSGYRTLTDCIQIGQSHFQFRIWGDGTSRRWFEILDPIKGESALSQLLNMTLFMENGGKA